MPHLYLDALAWRDGDNGVGWYPPSPHVVGQIDLRSHPERMDPASTAPRCLLSLSEPDSALGGHLGEYADRAALHEPVDPSVIAVMESRLGLDTGALEAATMADAIAEALTHHADPTGEARWKPLLSETVYLGGFSPIWEGRQADDPVWRDQILGVLQVDFGRVAQQARDGQLRHGERVDRQHHRRVLGWLDRKWSRCGITAADIAPGVTPLPPETTITESFDQVDSSTLGPDLTWAEVLDDFETISNEATAQRQTQNSAAARAEHDLSGDDHWSQSNAYPEAGVNNEPHMCLMRVRFDPTDNTCYGGGPHANLDDVRIFKFESGATTLLGNSSPFTVDAGTVYLVRIEAEGSTVRVLVDDIEKLSLTDTAITGHLRTGFGYYTGSVANNFDRWFFQDFEASDLGGGTVHSLVVEDSRHVHASDEVGLFTAPAGLVATSTGSSSIQLTWDAVALASAYDIERDAAVIALDVAATSYDDLGLDPSTEYTYRVRAVR